MDVRSVVYHLVPWLKESSAWVKYTSYFLGFYRSHMGFKDWKHYVPREVSNYGNFTLGGANPKL